MIPPASRGAWLDAALGMIAELYKDAGHEAPPCRVSLSFMWRTGADTVGQCAVKAASPSGHNEIFITPFIEGTLSVLKILAHEYAHAVDDCQSAHGKAFQRIAASVGMSGSPYYSRARGRFLKALQGIARALGPYPHAAMIKGALLAPRAVRKPSRTRRYECDDCEGGFSCTPRQSQPFTCPFCQSPNISRKEKELPR